MSVHQKVVYSTKEKALLASLVEQFKNKLESKKTDSTSNATKNEAWKDISELYNTHDVVVRSPAQLKKCWENMKYKTRKADTHVRHNMLLTGGGPPEKDTIDIIDDMVRTIVPTINYSISNAWDSTGIVESDNINLLDVTETSKRCEESSSCTNNKSNSTSNLEKGYAIDDVPKLLISAENLETTEIVTPKRVRNNQIEEINNSAQTTKRKRSVVDEEKQLRLKKLEESIQQQQELHKLRMEAVEAEKTYWIERTKLLNNKE